MLTAILCLFRISREYVKCISRTRPRKYILPRRKKRKTKKKAQRKTNVSLAETLIGAGFPRYEEIVKRFMKAFMKGFTRHGPNWGPGFASATHVLPRRRGTPSCPPRNPAGPYMRSSFFLFIFSSSRSAPRTSRVFSIDPRKCLVFHHHHHIRRRYFARSRPSCFFFSLLVFLYALLSSSDIFHWTVFSLIETFSRRQA